jgi:hypothetical protein
MEFSISLFTDDDGFLRRECPTCERQFKWFHGETAERPPDLAEPELYFCPYCGVSAPTDQWWTPEQLEHAQEEIAPEVMQLVADELNKSLRSASSSLIKMSVNPGPAPVPPTPLTEPNDMVMVEPPCHVWEPLKVVEVWTEQLHCLVCGIGFVVP